MTAYLPLQQMLTTLSGRYTTKQKADMPATYESDVKKGAKLVCKIIGYDLGDEGDRVVKCLWTELKHIESLNTAETILQILKEFTERFMVSEEGRDEMMRLIGGDYCVDSDSENSDCDSLCSDSCDSSEKRERDGWHRMRMVVREMAGAAARRTGVALKKNIKMRLVRKMC